MKPGWRANLIELAMWFAAAIGSVVLALVIGGCAHESKFIKGTGERADPPYGWVEFCQTYPQHDACPKQLKR